MEITNENFIRTVYKTIERAEALRSFAKTHHALYFAYKFIKHYSAIVQAYEETEKEARGEKSPGILRRIFNRIFKKRSGRTTPSPLLIEAPVSIYGLSNIDGRCAEQIVELILKKRKRGKIDKQAYAKRGDRTPRQRNIYRIEKRAKSVLCGLYNRLRKYENEAERIEQERK